MKGSRKLRPTQDEPVRVAIIGGGCAGMSAAWHLSQQPGYDIHVYERSWRLGGKCASVRNADGCILDHGLHVWLGYYENAFRMMRECYKEIQWHKSRMPGSRSPPMRTAHDSVEDAFFPEPLIGVARPTPPEDWVMWSGYFPPGEGLPGTDFDAQTNPFTLSNYLLRTFELLKTLMLSVIGTPKDDTPGRPRPDARSKHDDAVNADFSINTATSASLAIDRMTRLLRNSSLTGAAVLLQSVTILERWLQTLDDFAPQAATSPLKLMEAIAAQTRKLLDDVTSIDEHVRIRSEMIDIVLTTLVGLLRDRVPFHESGLDSLNHWDYRKWLLQNGATFSSQDSRYLTGNYDFAFAYRNGERNQPELAAGVALRGAFRMLFTYRGAMFWRIRSGMGDAVFAPLYRVLLAGRKVKDKEGQFTAGSPVHFHFLHELKEIEFEAEAKGSRYVSSLTFATRGDPDKLDDSGSNALDKLGCWPDGPAQAFENALKTGPGIKTIRSGEESGFDCVIFALGIDDFKASIKKTEFAKLPAKWATMCAQVKTIATQSAQVWMKRDLHGLGWYRGSGIFSALGSSFDTWADMTHALASERFWRNETKQRERSDFDEARSVAYFCAALPDSVIKNVRKDICSALPEIIVEVGKRARGTRSGEGTTELIMSIVREKLPARRNGTLDALAPELEDIVRRVPLDGWNGSYDELKQSLQSILERWLLKAKVAADLDRMLTQDMKPMWPSAFNNGATAKSDVIAKHVEANFDGSDRYTLSLPGSIVHRISPLDRSVENMTIAGDWTACGLDTGCVEAAVISGMLAAHAISGKPELNSIVGYDHP
jgi:uncharacterized protein with NAD-binding domain and iron-sulfur cluster